MSLHDVYLVSCDVFQVSNQESIIGAIEGHKKLICELEDKLHALDGEISTTLSRLNAESRAEARKAAKLESVKLMSYKTHKVPQRFIDSIRISRATAEDKFDMLNDEYIKLLRKAFTCPEGGAGMKWQAVILVDREATGDVSTCMRILKTFFDPDDNTVLSSYINIAKKDNEAPQGSFFAIDCPALLNEQEFVPNEWKSHTIFLEHC